MKIHKYVLKHRWASKIFEQNAPGLDLDIIEDIFLKWTYATSVITRQPYYNDS